MQYVQLVKHTKVIWKYETSFITGGTQAIWVTNEACKYARESINIYFL